jgi:hypothetical protein
MTEESIQILDNLLKKLDNMMKQAQKDIDKYKIICDTTMICRDELDFALGKIKKLENP